MPGPPPPPPPAAFPPVCPPPPAFNHAPSKGDSRGALLQSIRKGTNLKKTVTNDRSAPAFDNRVPTASNKSNHNSSSLAPTTISNGAGLGGLFAGGMPKLKPIGKQSGGVNISNNNTDYNNSDYKSSGQMQLQSNLHRNFSCVQNDVQSALKKQMASNSNRNRGPPPPAPTRNISQSTEHLQISGKQPYHSRNGSSNGLHLSISTLHRPSSSPHQSPTLPNPSFSMLHENSSTLHRKANSSANLTSYDITEIANNEISTTSYMRKPNLAPKPPVLNGKPAAPPKRLIINGRPPSLSRAQSMKSPRTPSPQSPEEFNYASKFGTVRNMSAILDKSLGQKMRPSINGRPTAPPPLAPLQQTTPLLTNKISVVKPPSHAPPPPPNAAPQPPPHAPPPPPQRGNYQAPVRTPPAVPSSSAPPPPPRHSSMRDLNGSRMSLDLDYKFRNEFRSIGEFPQPGPYRGLAKLYSNQESAC